MRLIKILLPTLMLAACSQPTPPANEAAAPSTSPPATAPTAAEDAPQAGLSPDAVEPTTAATPDTAPPVAGTDSAATPADASADAEGGARERITKLLGDAAPYESVFNELQRSVAAGDRAAVAGLMRYPVRVTIAGKNQKVADAAAFQRDYDRIVTPALAKLIAEQKFDTLFVNWQGVMLGQGEVWINGTCLDKECTKSDVKVNNIGQ
ncbi:hypothetical protein B8X02_16290 [Stenotrophomonas rhizophila]|uniref:hypothetical protein n=1 Tax=Stenotrophomonas TaxID=40323 RepID=UPI000BA4F744|nr:MULTISPECIES: hypothetical protein [Stenotrophomonas]MDQ1064099.1 hypothetical protein [Stenotrophomonas sp. SORGH_AS_0282]MDQ1187531.1 hypothetical protein [Stenotrophomonas sp. SORGH_AS_0282]PAK90619.1 hypothetical protein B8X02_16290 [Stenotrophomonas rhizophila]